jgi:hypothetical protein
MDAQTVSQIHHMMKRSQREVAANAQVLGYLTIIMGGENHSCNISDGGYLIPL